MGSPMDPRPMKPIVFMETLRNAHRSERPGHGEAASDDEPLACELSVQVQASSSSTRSHAGLDHKRCCW